MAAAVFQDVVSRKEELRRAAIAVASFALAFSSSTAFATSPGANGRIAYGIQSGAGYAIHTILPDGTGDRIVTSGCCPVWSPSGHRIALLRANRYGSSTNLFIAGARGASPHRLTRARSIGSFSPHGARIVFTRDDKGGEPHVFTIRTDGSDEQRLAPGSNAIYSPLARQIAFEGPGDQIWIMRADGSHMRRLTQLHGGATPGDFYPNGRLLLFLRFQGGVQTAYTTPINGGPIHPLGACVGRGPSFSPDGQQLLSLHGYLSGGIWTGEIDVGPADGSCPVRHVLVFRNLGFGGFDWQALPAP